MGPYTFSFLVSLFILAAPISVLGDACENVNCVRGDCVLNKSLLLGFDCLCYPGWKKAQVGFLILPACVLPNCTVEYQGGPPPALAPLPPPPPPAPFNILNPCNLVWCGDGTCVPNTTGYNCNCNPGSANVVNLTALPCIKEGAFGIDCNELKLGQPETPPPPPPLPSNGMLVPLPSPPGSLPNGSNTISRSWRTCKFFNIILLSAIILASLM